MKQFLVINGDTLCKTVFDSDFYLSSQDDLPHPMTILAVKNEALHRVGLPLNSQDVITSRLATMVDLVDFNATKGNIRAMKQQAAMARDDVDSLHEIAKCLSAEHIHYLELYNWHYERLHDYIKETKRLQDAYIHSYRPSFYVLSTWLVSHDEHLSDKLAEFIIVLFEAQRALFWQPIHSDLPPVPPQIEEIRRAIRHKGDSIHRHLSSSLDHYYKMRDLHQFLLESWRLNNHFFFLKNSTCDILNRMKLIEYDYELIRTTLAAKGHDINALWSSDEQSAHQLNTDAYFDCIRETRLSIGELISKDRSERQKSMRIMSEDDHFLKTLQDFINR